MRKIVGVSPSKVNIKALKDRWESVIPTDGINLNYSLMKASRNVITYVILHELYHFKIKDHSPRFWNLIEKYMPKYKESVKWLEINGIRINLIHVDTMLGKISVRKFKPKTVKKGIETTMRKIDLQKAFVEQNENLSELQDKCKDKKLSIDVTFYLNKNTPDKTSYKKDLDNLLKILMDVIKEEMDDDEKKIGLGLVIGNRDEEIFEIICHKEFVSTEDDEGIDLIVSEWKI